jgi:hypothetical protein
VHRLWLMTGTDPFVEATGPSKVLCRFPECTNPNCQFRHEDAEGNVIPPPALTRKLAGASAMKVDGAEGEAAEGTAKPIPGKPFNGMIPTPCRFGSGCLNTKCRFTHDNRRPCHFGIRCFKGTSAAVVFNLMLTPRSRLPILTSTRT